MTKKHEELVEEIARRIISQFGLVTGSITAHNLAKRFIALILSAVRDGLEIPGEVGRGDVCALAKGDNTPYYLRFDEAFEEGIETGDRFIALRKEGTGKKEEK